MNDTAKRTIAGLEKAMQAELEGYHFYQMAAQNTKDAQGQEAFKSLAEDERDHFNFLKAQRDAIAETGTLASDITLGEPKPFTGDHPIFSKEVKTRVGGAHYEMTALGIGIQLEKSAVDFYRGEAEATEDPGIKKFYLELMKWEQGHLEALSRQADDLQKDYWAEAGFAPF